MNFDRADWNQVKQGIMIDLLREMFKPGSKVANFFKDTTGKSLADAGTSKSFAIGMSLHHKNIFNTKQWPKDINILDMCPIELETS